eukprot:scaffold243516_cov23-Prasinocladus_malaysianus.AAC.1
MEWPCTHTSAGVTALTGAEQGPVKQPIESRKQGGRGIRKQFKVNEMLWNLHIERYIYKSIRTLAIRSGGHRRRDGSPVIKSCQMWGDR